MSNPDRKKATHLRCERQRREAINTGYNDLKDLLPASANVVGCKTTNAAILFRAADYVKQLNSEIKKDEDELAKMQTQLSALELIAQQYESFSDASKPEEPVQVEMMTKFLDACFDSFSEKFNDANYESITRSILGWTETADLKKPAEAMLNAAITKK
uniref:BHLH domain-containing protein n=1 Tax=Panagrellus redivivus TaxID=6233 RepID=A0A7E4VP48_PANRE